MRKAVRDVRHFLSKAIATKKRLALEKPQKGDPISLGPSEKSKTKICNLVSLARCATMGSIHTNSATSCADFSAMCTHRKVMQLKLKKKVRLQRKSKK